MARERLASHPVKLLTTGQVARAFGVAPATVAGWHDAGMIVGHRLPSPKGADAGDHRRFRRSDVLAFASSHNLPLLLDGADHEFLAGVVLCCTADAKIVDALRASRDLAVHQVLGLAELGFWAARLLPGWVVIDRALAGRDEVRAAWEFLRRQVPGLQLIAVLGEDDPGDGYPPGVRLACRPFDAARAVAVLLGKEG